MPCGREGGVREGEAKVCGREVGKVCGWEGVANMPWPE